MINGEKVQNAVIYTQCPMNTELSIITIISFLDIYFFSVLDKKCNEEEKISTGASYKTTQRIWMKSGMGRL